MSLNGLEEDYEDVDEEEEPDFGTLATKQVKYESNKVIFDITTDHVEQLKEND